MSFAREKSAVLPVIAVAVICGGGLFLLAIIALRVVFFLSRGPDQIIAVAEDAPQAVKVAQAVPAGQENALPPIQAPEHGGNQANLQPIVPFQPAQVDPVGGLPLATLDLLKRSTVFIKVEAGSQLATGSGFLARIEGDAAFVVTNHHVVKPPPARFTPFRPKFGNLRPNGGSALQPIYTLVFGSGTKEERSYKIKEN